MIAQPFLELDSQRVKEEVEDDNDNNDDDETVFSINLFEKNVYEEKKQEEKFHSIFNNFSHLSSLKKFY